MTYRFLLRAHGHRFRRGFAAAALAVAASCGPDRLPGEIPETSPPSSLQASHAALALGPGRIPAEEEARPLATTLILAQQAKLLANDAMMYDGLGVSVALDGDTALVGADNDGDNGPTSGSAYVFVRKNGVWTQEAKLLPSDGAQSDQFGHSIALSGDTALVGSWLDDDKGTDSGSVYVFVRNNGVWTQQAKLLASDGAANDEFSRSIALEGDTALVGAYRADPNGAAYVFVRSGSVWTEQAKLLANDGAPGALFGYSVALSGQTALIGTPHDDDQGQQSGSAYVFVRSGAVWTQEAKLLASDGVTGKLVGWSAAADGDTAVVGAKWDNTNGSVAGAAYVFVRTGGAWTEEAKLLASDGVASDEFGHGVALSGDMVVATAINDDAKGVYSGSAYVFVRTGGAWTEEAKLLASDGGSFDYLGYSVALAANTVLVGAFGKVPAGAAYVYVVTDVALGNPCGSSAECVSGFCADGVCCDAACGGSDPADCQACSMAAGAAVDGICGLVSQGTSCRPAGGACDVLEVCDGVGGTCPVDDKVAAGTECRASAGECDIAESCDGIEKDCPADGSVPDGTMCSGGTCAGGVCMGGSGGAGGAGGSAGSGGNGGAGGGSTGSGSTGSGGSSSGSGSTSSSSSGGGPGDEGGCACRAAGGVSSDSSHETGGALGLIGLGFIAMRRRRTARA